MMKNNRLLANLCLTSVLTGALVACQFPSPTTPSIPSTPSVPSSAPSTPAPASPGGAPPSGSTPDSGEAPSAPAGEDQASESEGGASGSAGEETTVGSLDEQLDEALEDFDEAVQNQGGGGNNEEIDILSPAGGGSGATSNDPLFEEGDLGEGQESVENDDIAQRASDGASGDAAGSPADGQPSGSAGSSESAQEADDIIPIPEDVGDGRGDDIVLRQIRDAALQERDAVLREKLWDEYRRIKNQR